MFLELVCYELVTGILPFIGIKVWADKRYLRGINQRKQTMFDGYLRRRVGPMTRTEKAISTRAAKAVQYISKFQAFQYLLVLAARHAQNRATRSTSWPTGND